MGARSPLSGETLKGGFYLIVAGPAFCLSAYTALTPPQEGSALSPGFAIPADVRGENSAAPHTFYLPNHYSSFADDTALYAGAYRRAESLVGVKGGGGSAGSGGKGDRRERIVAGTISHHLYIRDLIAQYFVTIARYVHPKRIILIGPNHRARGDSPIALSGLRWRTPFGFVEPDSDAIRKISGSGAARVEEEPFVNEHSIGALAPFIRRTFPGARIVPIIFKKVAGRENCVKLAGVISGLMDSTLVLASLDFSHYRTSGEAEKEDAASLHVIRSLSTDRVDEAFVDSRPALLTLFSLCRDIGATRVEVVLHTNSGILSHKPLVPCTSYINTYIAN
jgi:AmmeMemoRadiSam system protein B